MERRIAIAGWVIGVVAVVGGCTTAPSTPPQPTAPLLTTTTTTVTTTSTVPSVSTTSLPAETTTTADPASLRLQLVEVASGFSSPVLLRADPGGAADFVVEQPGRIVRLDAQRTVALDIQGDVAYGGERGLLGLAFHPDFASNGLAYVDYTDGSGRTVIEQFEVRDGTFAVTTRKRIIEIPQPARNHNGGMIDFGPNGYLWIGMGDGGGSYDRFDQGQRSDTLLGAMLRIAVGVEGIDTYAIPPDNPFADGVDGRPEVWATGLRNPWRFTISGRDVWIADVGQDAVEEVDVAQADAAGINYGWPIMEGDRCLADGCDRSGLHPPIAVYDHGEGCSISGGAVYEGAAIPALTGHFFYSDFCTGFIRSVTRDGAVFDWTPSTGSAGSVAAVSVGSDGEIHVVSLDGRISRLEERP